METCRCCNDTADGAAVRFSAWWCCFWMCSLLRRNGCGFCYCYGRSRSRLRGEDGGGAAREIWVRGWLQVRHREASLARVCRSFRSAMKNGGGVAELRSCGRSAVAA